jgi:O-methyltransferase
MRIIVRVALCADLGVQELFVFAIRHFLGRMGFEINRADNRLLEKDFQDIVAKARVFTMASSERLYAVFQAARHVVKNGIEGDIVECGVWRGGASMVAAMSLLAAGESSRRIWLYDTFAGMTKPTDKDVHRWAGKNAFGTWRRWQKSDHNDWCFAGLDDVRRNLYSTGYPRDHIEFVAGDVANTLLTGGPQKISLLRLDTDWYDSTRKELEILYPRLSVGGVLLIDDYGVWDGARQAVDEYFEQHNVRMLLQRTDYTGRMGVKM